jgi:hypothetical protein
VTPATSKKTKNGLNNNNNTTTAKPASKVSEAAKARDEARWKYHQTFFIVNFSED